MSGKKLIAVDLDGTLIDTSLVNSRSYREALEEYGFTVSDEYYMKNCYGRYYLDFLPGLMGENPEPELVEAVHNRKKKIYSSCASAGRRNDALYEILKSLHGAENWHTALVTTGNPKNTEEILKAFDCYDLFDLILTSADVCKSKPDPEGYLMAMERFGVSPEDTVIFEDSGTGMKAAIASGATVFQVDLSR